MSANKYEPVEGRFYASSNGQTSCGSLRHGGGYLNGELAYRPDARRIETPLTTWYRMTKAEIRQLLIYIRDHPTDTDSFGNTIDTDPTPQVCEGCRYDAETEAAL